MSEKVIHEVSVEIKPNWYRAYFDCSFNGTPAFGVGYTIVDPTGKIIVKESEKVGYSKSTLSNKSWGTYKKEQTALLRLVAKLTKLKIDKVAIFGDHIKLIARVKKHNTEFSVHKPKTTEELLSARGMMSKILGHLRLCSEWTLDPIPSNQNIVADLLAKRAIDVRRHETIDTFTEFKHWEVEHLTWTERH